jgi:methylmalonyl-CoA carboxyltransferase large subunit
MKPESPDWTQVTRALESLREELAGLRERVAALEGSANAKARRATPEPAPSPAPRVPDVDEGLSEELLLVISAAIAAFLGKKPHIRQIRLLGSAAWSQQGRVTIQASHVLTHRG